MFCQLCYDSHHMTNEYALFPLSAGHSSALASTASFSGPANPPISPCSKELPTANSSLYVCHGTKGLALGILAAGTAPFVQLASSLIISLAIALHYLDDFLFAGRQGTLQCEKSVLIALNTCTELGIPVAMDKKEGPATSISFLGILFDMQAMQLRLPTDKYQQPKHSSRCTF